MKITKVLGSRVLVKLISSAPEAEAENGIVVSAASVNPNYFKGEVVTIGQGVKRSGTTGKAVFDVGDKVCFAKYGYEDMGDGLFVVEEDCMICVYE